MDGSVKEEAVAAAAKEPRVTTAEDRVDEVSKLSM